ncbi:vitellogenin-1-like [Calliphora vicina]|uniref:vitellogenin-1-like n=1 Tax=Calliphora vicina TaxID=7373 RepID=UPI00325AED51
MLTLKLLVTLLFCCGLFTQIVANDVSNNTNSLDIFSIINGLVPQLPKWTVKMEQLFRLPIQALFALPEVSVAQTINQYDALFIGSIYLTYGDVRPRITPNISKMEFILQTPCLNESFPLLQVDEIVESPNFNVSKKLILFVRGWYGYKGESAETLAKAFHCRGEHNFLLLDTANFIDTLYSWSALNTEAIGEYMALGLTKLVNKYPLENIHLIGHSLGAHIVGYAGRYFTKFSNQTIPHITGLDPANPCFNEGEILYGIQRGDAGFIDIIHSNPGALGKKEPIGDADFYPEGLAPIKPGCFTLGCSHSRSWKYYAESVYPGNEYNFMGTRCNSLKKKEDGFCNGYTYPMGIEVPLMLRGNYFFSVNKAEPFGKNATDDAKTPLGNCGSCPGY